MAGDFFSRFIEHLQDCTMIPKVQVERAVGPILGLFLADVLTATLRDDRDLSGEITMVSPECPLRKTGSHQSINIDWLLLNKVRHCLLFVELKTADTSADELQVRAYRSAQARVRSSGGDFLIDDVGAIGNESGEHGKYQFLLDKKIAPHAAGIRACRDARILYLAPHCMREKLRGHVDRHICFGDLASDLAGPDAEHWRALLDMLRGLDGVSRATRNGAGQHSPGTRWAGTCRFEEMVEKCKELGDDVVIGYRGGREAFRRATLRALAQRRGYKWDKAGNMSGKNPREWLSGSELLAMLRTVHDYRG